jgi:hypothetical protein
MSKKERLRLRFSLRLRLGLRLGEKLRLRLRKKWTLTISLLQKKIPAFRREPFVWRRDRDYFK